MKKLGLILLVIILSTTFTTLIILSHSNDENVSKHKRSKTHEVISASVDHSKIQLKKKHSYPVVFVHGWTGTEGSFRSMLNRMTSVYEGPERALLIYVKPNGKLIVHGKITNQRIPLIQVVFQNNKGSLDEQTKWFETTMQWLKQKQHIQTVDLVTHSFGGKTATYFLETTSKSRKDYPAVNKFVPIAAPFSWRDGPQDDSKLTVDQMKRTSVVYPKRDQLPHNLDVLAIGGIINKAEAGDGTVKLKSAFLGRYIFTHQKYQEKTVTGRMAQHSMLHENPKVDALIADFLWGVNNK
ncbi:alpha/beta hydrolase [Terrilactibacillus laevilacticus]|uniref:Alpha/beta hydrolase n=1 Tax=Terrilactibacillus laevilacticus TaxID=1380157 RepID=A0ABW5PRY4_9BACI|nr:alpha/beta hydrolase [Terrilactibacillus laevilacticus]